MNFEERINELGLELPEYKPMKSPNVVRARQSGNILYCGGVGPWDGNCYPYLGKLGLDLTADQGYKAGRITGLHLISIIKHYVGDLNRVKQFLRGLGIINHVDGFKELSKVTNGCTDLIIEVFGHEVGTHSRASIGVSELAHNIPFEFIIDIELTD